MPPRRLSPIANSSRLNAHERRKTAIAIMSRDRSCRPGRRQRNSDCGRSAQHLGVVPANQAAPCLYLQRHSPRNYAYIYICCGATTGVQISYLQAIPALRAGRILEQLDPDRGEICSEASDNLRTDTIQARTRDRGVQGKSQDRSSAAMSASASAQR